MTGKLVETSAPKKKRRSAVTTPAMLACAAIVGQLVASKATRDGLFLSTYEVTALPRWAVLAAVASIAAALVFSRALSRWSPARVVPVALGASAASYAVEWALVGGSPRIAAALLYVHVAVLGGTLLAGFWSLLNESFDPHSAKREIGSIAMGGTLGGVLGGLSGFWVGHAFGPAALLGPLAAVNLLAVPAVLRVARLTEGGAAKRPAPKGPAPSGLRAFRQLPYLRLLALLTLLSAVTSALLDYVLSSNVVHAVARGPALVTFFSLFHTGVGVGAFLLQATLTRPALERLGLAGTIVLAPAVVLVGSVAAWLEGGLWSAVALRAADAIMGASLYRAAYELLYTPLPPQQKRPSKVLIDVGVDRAGTALGSGVVVVALLVAEPRHALLAIAGAGAMAMVGISIWVHRAYVAALARSLRSGVVLLRSSDVIDATTRRTLANSGAMNRSELLKRIEALQVKSELPSIAPDPVPSEEDEEVIPESSAVGFMAAPRSLRWDLPVEPAEALVDRLADDEHARDALQALRGLAEDSIDVLASALLEPKRLVAVRRRLPRVLEVVQDERAVQALVEGLFAIELDVREQCVLALLKLTERYPQLPVPSARIEEAALRETLLGRDAVRGRAHVSSELRARVDRGVELTLLLLSVVIDREPMQLALRALFGRDAALRGTALEYLHNVLPRRILENGEFMLENIEAKRSKRELVDELLRSRDR